MKVGKVTENYQVLISQQYHVQITSSFVKPIKHTVQAWAEEDVGT